MKSTSPARSSGTSPASRSRKRTAVAAILSVLAALVLISACSGQKGAGGKNDVAETILSLTNKYNAVWETLEWERIAPFHSNDIRYYWRGVLASSSQAEFKRHFHEDILTEIQGYSATTVDPHVQALGSDAGVVSFEFRGQVVTPDGKTHDYSGAMSYVFERREGDWKIVLIHESAPVPEQ